MPHPAPSQTSTVQNGHLLLTAKSGASGERIAVGSEQWFAWLRGRPSFKVVTPNGGFSVRPLPNRNDSWEGYRTISGKRVRWSLGRHSEITSEALAAADAGLVAQARTALPGDTVDLALRDALQPLAPVLSAEIDPEAALAAITRATTGQTDHELQQAVALARRLIEALIPAPDEQL